MDISATTKMPVSSTPSTLTLVLQFIKDSWPMIGGIVAIYKVIDKVAEYYSKKQETKLRELIKAEVTPELESLKNGMEELTKSIWALEQKIQKIK